MPPTKGKNPKNEEEDLVREASPDEILGVGGNCEDFRARKKMF